MSWRLCRGSLNEQRGALAMQPPAKRAVICRSGRAEAAARVPYLAAVRAQLDETTFAAAWAEGETWGSTRRWLLCYI